MTLKLIVNADDFGLSRAVNLGIAEAFANGIVRSTTLMAGMPAFDHAVAIAGQHPGLGTGIHLTLSMGRPVLAGHKTLTDEQGLFKHQDFFHHHIDQIDLAEVQAEFIAQIEKAQAAGLTITHLDGHHHVHGISGIREIVCQLCQRYGLAARPIDEEHKAMFRQSNVKIPDGLSTSFFGESVTIEGLQRLIMDFDGQSLEVMSHPGYLDRFIYENSSYNIKRIYELSVLTSDEMQKWIEERGIILCGYDGL